MLLPGALLRFAERFVGNDVPQPDVGHKTVAAVLGYSLPRRSDPFSALHDLHVVVLEIAACLDVVGGHGENVALPGRLNLDPSHAGNVQFDPRVRVAPSRIELEQMLVGRSIRMAQIRAANGPRLDADCSGELPQHRGPVAAVAGTVAQRVIR